jgi:hypothetical protein
MGQDTAVNKAHGYQTGDRGSVPRKYINFAVS